MKCIQFPTSVFTLLKAKHYRTSGICRAARPRPPIAASLIILAKFMAFIEIPAKNPTWEKIRESVLKLSKPSVSSPWSVCDYYCLTYTTLKGLSHEIDFKIFFSNLQSLA
jgi:hypothetical protein